MINYWNRYNKRYGSSPWVAGGLFIGEYFSSGRMDYMDQRLQNDQTNQG
jgi:hypothetical protein